MGAEVSDELPPPAPQAAKCSQCQQTFETLKSGMCPACLEAVMAPRRARWEKICPTIYRESDKTKFPGQTYAEVKEWKFGPQGLMLCGPPRVYKTRMMFTLIRRLVVNEGRSVRVLNGFNFERECAKEHFSGDAYEWVEQILKADVLFFDDLGKCKMTERVEDTLFGIIEERVAWSKPILITTNDTDKSLAARMTVNRAEALVGRLKEFCKVISVT
jgi:hypothetical protein